MPANISPDVVIMTQHEFRTALDKAFLKGVERGRFEESWDRSRAAEQKASPASNA